MTKGGFGGGMGGGQSPNPSGAPGGQLGDIFTDMLKNGPLGGGMGGGQATPEPEAQAPSGMPDLNDIFGRGNETPTEPEAENQSQSPYPKGTGFDDLFGDLFKPTSRGIPKEYEKGIELIFDQFLPKK